jgi:putative aldouronate transport system permease protein
LILYGWRYAFYNYKPGLTIGPHNFVGFDNFTLIIQDKYALQDITRVMRNTLAMSIIGMITPLPMVFAIFLNEIRRLRYRKVVQTLTTIPNFISWVLVYAVAYAMFSVDDGFVDLGISFLSGRDIFYSA